MHRPGTGHVARLGFSRRADGDLRTDDGATDDGELHRRQQAVAPGEWTWLRQVHGRHVVRVDRPGAHAGAAADAAVTDVAGAVLAVHTADCAAVLFHAATDAVVGVAHVGWRGLASGVLEATVAAMGRLGAGGATAFVGPHIRPRCYEFGADDLATVAARYGHRVRGETAWGAPALDLLGGVRAALETIGVDVVDHGGCTACEPGSYFSHRARGEHGRQAGTIVLDDTSADGAAS